MSKITLQHAKDASELMKHIYTLLETDEILKLAALTYGNSPSFLLALQHELKLEKPISNYLTSKDVKNLLEAVKQCQILWELRLVKEVYESPSVQSSSKTWILERAFKKKWSNTGKTLTAKNEDNNLTIKIEGF